MDREKNLRNFHEAQWDEPIIYEESVPGSCAITLPELTDDEKAAAKKSSVPQSIRRDGALNLPEMAQPQVLRHYLRLSQETIGQDENIDIGLGTCTMKYSPKIDEQFVKSPKFADIHPLQDDSTVQGMLKVIYDFEQMMCKISGMDAVSFQAGSGGQGIYANASVLKKYWRDRGQEKQRTQIITTILSHPIDAAAPATKGFEVITLMPNANGYPSVDDLRAVVSDKTAGIFITNPEDTGVFNPIIHEFVDIVHRAGGLCVCDMADYNGMWGLIRAKELGADMCHFNLHKAFSSPHGCMGPGCAAQCVTKELEKYLPRPRVRFDGKRYYCDYDGPDAIGRIRQFHGSLAAVLRAYAWVLTLGDEGLKTVGEIAVLNNNYMMKRLLTEVKGISRSYDKEAPHRLEQVRYSWENLKKDTGIGGELVNRRLLDFGFQRFFASHHPEIVPEPFTPEPTESYSKADIDEYVDALKEISWEAYHQPEIFKGAPHNAPIHRLQKDSIDSVDELEVTWRAVLKHRGRDKKEKA